MRVMTHMPTRKKKMKRVSAISGASSAATTTTTTTSYRTTTPLRLEKIAIGALFMIAWGWIVVTLGMVFYHGYYNNTTSHHRSSHGSFRQHNHAADNAVGHLFPGDGRKTAAAISDGGIQQQNEQQQQQHPAPGLPQSKALAASASGTSILQPYESPLLIFTCHREEYLNQTLSDILKYIPRDCRMGCPIIISQDGNYEPVTRVIQWYQDQFATINIPLVHWQHTSALRGASSTGAAAYQALAVHYGWALKQVFDNKAATITNAIVVEPKRVLILEEDLHVAVDFFDYFMALAPILDRDASLLAISAYNDNGFDHAVQDVHRVVRSDFFPGLGWMMTRKLWINELQMKWPNAYWDDWLREPQQRQGRHVLRPEVSRTFHFGVSGGASNNQFGNQLSKVLLNPTPVQWSNQDLSYLNLHHYDRAYWQMLHSSRRVSSLAEAKQLIGQQQQAAAAAGNTGTITNNNRRSTTTATRSLVLRLEYNNMQEFAKFASSLGLSSDEKAGVPRTAYKGVVETRFGTTITTPATAAAAAALMMENGSAGTNNNNSISKNNNNHILLLTPPMQELQKEFEDVI